MDILGLPQDALLLALSILIPGFILNRIIFLGKDEFNLVKIIILGSINYMVIAYMSQHQISSLSTPLFMFPVSLFFATTISAAVVFITQGIPFIREKIRATLKPGLVLNVVEPICAVLGYVLAVVLPMIIFIFFFIPALQTSPIFFPSYPISAYIHIINCTTGNGELAILNRLETPILLYGYYVNLTSINFNEPKVIPNANQETIFLIENLTFKANESIALDTDRGTVVVGYPNCNFPTGTRSKYER